MLTRRLVVCLDVKGGRVVKGTQFVQLRDVGDPVELATRYEREGADEVVFLDISASAEERGTLLDVARRTAERLFVPLTIGGGVRTVDDVGRALRSGADKVSINSAAVVRPEILTEAAERFGSQCVVASIDAKRDGDRWRVYVKGGREATPLDAVEWAVECVRRGAGEILLTSIDRDGARTGYDLALTRAVADVGARAGRRVRRRGDRGARVRGARRRGRRRRAARGNPARRRDDGGRGEGGDARGAHSGARGMSMRRPDRHERRRRARARRSHRARRGAGAPHRHGRAPALSLAPHRRDEGGRLAGDRWRIARRRRRRARGSAVVSRTTAFSARSSARSGPARARRWIIDPIDGTKSFVRGVPLWGSLVALCEGDAGARRRGVFPRRGRADRRGAWRRLLVEWPPLSRVDGRHARRGDGAHHRRAFPRAAGSRARMASALADAAAVSRTGAIASATCSSPPAAPR